MPLCEHAKVFFFFSIRVLLAFLGIYCYKKYHQLVMDLTQPKSQRLCMKAIREGKMPESMQLVARVNAEAGGKVSVFDRLASTTTESRRQKVNDRDQLHENLR